MSSSHPRPRYDVNTLRAKVHEALRSHGKVSGPAPQVDNLTQATATLLMNGLSVKDIAVVLDRTEAYVRVMKRKLVLRAGLEPKRELKEKQPRATAAERKLAAGIPDLPIEELAALLEQLPPPNGWGLDAATLKKLGFEP